MIDRWLEDVLTGKRPKQALVVYTATRGGGKSVFARLFSALLPRDATAHAYSFHLPPSTRFNQIIEGKRLVVVDEFNERTAPGLLKKWITSDKIGIHSKGHDFREAPNVSAFLLLASAPIEFPMNERRFIQCSALEAFAHLALVLERLNLSNAIKQESQNG
ncbi:putative integrase [Sinorhizobium phage HMSP1-Susan]|nr:putative integrase [Sinorhizobium phage HMSP1-Susan]